MFLWLVTDNTNAGRFYENLGAKHIFQQMSSMGEQELSEYTYGWLDI